MSFAVALLLALQTADRAVLVRAPSGERVEITDPVVLQRLEPMTADERAPIAAVDWTVSLYKGGTRVRELRVLLSGSRQPIADFLREQEAIRRLSKELADDSQEIREKASRDLVALGRTAVEPMRKLSESAGDIEVRSRAARILKDLHAAARPRVEVRLFFARKDRPAAAPDCFDEWIRTAAADLGYPAIEGSGWTVWTDVDLDQKSLFPTGRPDKPGGVHVGGKVVEWTMDGAATIEITATVKSWKSGRYSVDATTPRTVIRLSDQLGGDLFVAIRLPGGR